MCPAGSLGSPRRGTSALSRGSTSATTKGLYRYCRSILRNDEDAADALQNTMVKTLRALPGESRGIALKPWLYRVAHSEAISVLRRRVHDQTIDGVAEVPSEQELDSVITDRLRRLIADLAELPERQRGARGPAPARRGTCDGV